MEEKRLTEHCTVEGYVFLNEEDAGRANSEKKKIAFVEEKLNYDRPEAVLMVYRKAIQDRVFKTPVGIQYLKTLQEYLLKRPEVDATQVLPIPVYVNYEGTLREQTPVVKPRIQPAKRKEKRSLLPLSLLLNIALLIAVIAMYVIALNAKQPNILNYEKAIQNKYAAWEQELSEREQALRDRELNNGDLP